MKPYLEYFKVILVLKKRPDRFLKPVRSKQK